MLQRAMKGVRYGTEETHRRANYQCFKRGGSRNEDTGCMPEAWDQ